jgi:hypothetical protein
MPRPSKLALRTWPEIATTGILIFCSRSQFISPIPSCTGMKMSATMASGLKSWISCWAALPSSAQIVR